MPYLVALMNSIIPVSYFSHYRRFLARLAAKVKEEVDDNVAGAEGQRGSLAALKKTRHGKVSHDRVKGKSGLSSYDMLFEIALFHK